MELNTTTLRGILAQILSVDSSHVVPKQGNWWNPQDRHQNIENWCAYRIKSNKPRTAPFYHEGREGSLKTNAATVLKIADIELQFVGPQSEDIAQSVSMWSMRSDVQQALAQVHGAILLDDNTAISSVFFQDGANTITAWNVNIRVIWYSIMETGQGIMPPININGKVIK